MNLLEIGIIFLIVGMAFWGFHRGFVKKLASMLSLILSVVLVSALLPYMTDFLQNQTPVYEYIIHECERVVTERVASGAKTGSGQTELFKGLDQLGRIEQTELIESLPIPDMIKEMLVDNNNSEGYRGLEAKNFQDYLVHFLAKVIMNVISFIAAVLVVQLLLWAVIAALNFISHIPVISIVNRMAGLLLGLLQALFLIWLFFLIVSMISSTEVGLLLMDMVQKSKVLSYLYDSNLFMQIVLQTAVIFA